MENKNKSSGFAAETDRDHWDEEGLHPFRCVRNTLEGEGGGVVVDTSYRYNDIILRCTVNT